MKKGNKSIINKLFLTWTFGFKPALILFLFAFSPPDDIPGPLPVLVSERLGPLAVLLAELAV